MLSDCQSFAYMGVKNRAALIKMGVGIQYFSDVRVVDHNPVLYDNLFHFFHKLILLFILFRQFVHKINHLLNIQLLGSIFDSSDYFSIGFLKFYTKFALLIFAGKFSYPSQNRQRNHISSSFNFLENSFDILWVQINSSIFLFTTFQIYQCILQAMFFLLSKLIYLMRRYDLNICF